jgi:general secretion pathway protein A
MIDALNDYLLSETVADRYVVLIIDEAQHLSPSVLEEIRMLSNLETARSKLLQIILVGQPELGEKLGRPGLRQLRQRIGLVANLRPLTYRETVQYMAHRLEVSGHKGQSIFTRPAVRKIYKASRGIPRLINVICDKTMLLGYGADAKRINQRLVAEVMKDWSVFSRGDVPPRVTLRTGRTRARRVVSRAPVGWTAAAVALWLLAVMLLL